MSFVEDALRSLDVKGYVIKGFIKNENDFNKNFHKVVGQEPNGTGILSNNSSDFGVTWKQLSDQIKIEEQKFKDTQYQRDRLKEYPSIQELVVALYDEEDKASIIERRNQVKAKYPKPE
tara:strand:- start:200 stop:556 length:357 start_codon:yes stop_codon:yes gene_type:complete